jgi:peptidase M23-like protein
VTALLVGLGRRSTLEGLYGWPLRPFDRAHPVRGTFNDPRIAGSSRSFHFGVDISAPNGTPVYAVRAGEVDLEGGRSLAVVAGDVAFGYWHVIPAVAHRQRVAKHELLGHVEAPWLHLHFAERRIGSYRDPLRPGALSPWTDTTRPHVTRIAFSRNGRTLAPGSIAGAVDVIAEAHQMPPLAVPPPWDGLPVTPARLRWRVRHGGRTVRPWRTPVDFSQTLLPADRFRWVYAPGTRQNRPGKPGLYRFFLAHTWSTTLLPDGDYRLEVEASDLFGNRGSLVLPFTLVNDL